MTRTSMTPTGWRCDAMTLTPIGYVVQIRVADVLCLYFTRLFRRKEDA